jgi:hypothetical protein
VKNLLFWLGMLGAFAMLMVIVLGIAFPAAAVLR